MSRDVPHFLPARQEPLGAARPLWVPGPLGQLSRRMGRPGRAAQGSRSGGLGGLLHNLVQAQQGGRVERPLAAPQALVPGQGNHRLKLLVSEGREGGSF